MFIPRLLSGVAATAVLASAALAQSFPTRPVTVVVGAAPGSSGDLLSRMLGQRLSEKWGQAVVVDNRTGASGLIASRETLKAAPNGYTIFISNDSVAINQSIMKTPPPDPRTVFAPISLLALIDFKLVVSSEVPARNVDELMKLVKAQPGKFSWASSGQYTPHHLMGELFRYQAGLDILHVPYKGTAPAVTAVMAGQSEYAFSGFPAVDPGIKAGKLRALASTGARRNGETPDLPTVGETIKGFSAASWWAMFVRAEVPADVQRKIAADVAATIAEPAFAKRMVEGGLDPVGGTPAQLTAFLGAEIDKWGKLPAGIIEKQD